MYGGGEVDVWMRACEDVNGQRREKRYILGSSEVSRSSNG